MRLSGLVLVAAAVSVAEAGFVYFPTAIQTYLHEKDSSFFAEVNSLTSTDGIIPYNFYTLGFCRPRVSTVEDTSIGSMLKGDSIELSNYRFKTLVDEKCVKVKCPNKEDNELTREQLAMFDSYIKRGYRGNMILDNLPVLAMWVINKRREEEQKNMCFKGMKAGRVTDVRGWPLGSCPKQMEEGSNINNHFDFVIKYNNQTDTADPKKMQYYVVGFYVSPKSVAGDDCNTEGEQYTTFLKEGETKKPISWTYSVKWEYDPTTRWVTRWDNYLNTSEADSDAKNHWIRIMQSLIVIMCLSGVVAIIVMRTLHLDFNRYNNPENEEEMQEEVGWKLVHTDVFRPPSYPNLFAALIGTGTQILGMASCTLLVALLGFMSPAHRGILLTTLIVLFVLLAFVNGYVTGLLQMMFSVKQWKTVILSGLIFPGFLCCTWAVTEMALARKGSSSAVPLGTVFSIMMLWFGICIPQMVLGATFSFRQQPIENPLRFNSMHRNIPPQRWIFSTPATLLIPGLIPFAAARFEIDLIMRAIWQGQVYYVFGFLALVFVVVAITVAETVIVFIYYQLVFEDYRWWWKSFLIPSGMGIYYFLAAIHYFNTILTVKTMLAKWIYFSFSFIVSINIVLLAGTIGFFAAWVFTRKIYSSIKIE